MAWPDLTTALSLSCLIGSLAAYLAYRRGRNPYIWFCIGVFFGLLGMIAIFFSPSKKWRRPIQTTQKKVPEPCLVGPSDKFWYYLDASHQQLGPMSFSALTKAWKEGKVTISTYVWHEDLSDWKLLQEFIQVYPT